MSNSCRITTAMVPTMSRPVPFPHRRRSEQNSRSSAGVSGRRSAAFHLAPVEGRRCRHVCNRNALRGHAVENLTRDRSDTGSVRLVGAHHAADHASANIDVVNSRRSEPGKHRRGGGQSRRDTRYARPRSGCNGVRSTLWRRYGFDRREQRGYRSRLDVGELHPVRRSAQRRPYPLVIPLIDGACATTNTRFAERCRLRATPASR